MRLTVSSIPGIHVSSPVYLRRMGRAVEVAQYHAHLSEVVPVWMPEGDILVVVLKDDHNIA